MKRLFGILILLGSFVDGMAQIASFRFSKASGSVTGWTDLSGDPHVSVLTATSGGITISSVSTSNWSPDPTNGCAADGIGAYPGAYFPIGVMSSDWFQYNGTSYTLALYNALLPQLELTGLNPDSSYILRMTASDVALGGSSIYTVAGASVAGSQSLVSWHNVSQGVTFQGVYPNATGMIKVYVNAPNGDAHSFIDGIQIFPGSANVGTPVVALTTPTNGTIFSEGGNISIAATASETGNTITKVEFYADTTKIGEADAAPYTMTWNDPSPGSYQIVAKATDNVGTIKTAQANIAVESLNYFWSTTGNATTNGDTNFVGTVDSNRLSFRTRNLERMSISAKGPVMVGTTNVEDSLYLHGTMTIRDSLAFYPLTIQANSIYSPFVYLSNTTVTQGATIGMRYYNSNGLVAQFFAGSPINTYMPNGYAFHDISGGGFDFVSAQPNSFVSWGNNFHALGGTKMIFYPATGHLILGSLKDSGNNSLQVNGNTWTTGLTIPTGATAGYVLTSDGNGNGSWQPGGSGWWSSGIGAVYDSVDNIAIGTSNAQGYKLAVNGSAIFTRVVVKPLANWPDYVFEKNYHLPDLRQVERYVREHQHLPGVASQKEVEDKGIDMAQQQAALLKKVEELTLYVIELDKKVSALQKENTRLKKTNTIER